MWLKRFGHLKLYVENKNGFYLEIRMGYGKEIPFSFGLLNL
jgi:hypothetical protein